MSDTRRPLVLLFTDSLGMPREFLEGSDRTTYAQTYPALLREQLDGRAQVDTVSSIGLDSEAGVYWSKFLIEPRRPDVLVLHLGVVDCAPRVFRKGSPSLLLRPWFLRLSRGYVMHVIHILRPLLCRARRLVYVEADEFESNLAALRDAAHDAHPDCRVIAIAISDKPAALERRSPGYRANVARYNAALQRVFGSDLVDINAFGDPVRSLISDGIHLNPSAHAWLAAELARRSGIQDEDTTNT